MSEKKHKKKGLLLINLGSPKSPTPKDVKSYLEEFLMDKYVIDLPYFLRTFIVKGIILNTRPKKSAEAYKKIWWKEGSPLIVITERLKEQVQKFLSMPVEIAMRYGQPDIFSGLQNLKDKEVTDVILLPLYPQYAMATVKTILVLSENLRQKYFSDMNFKIIPPFYKNEDYIQTISKSIKESLVEKYDMLLFSYHGVPNRHIRKSDITGSHCQIDDNCCKTNSPSHQFCYRHQCYDTTERVAKNLGLYKESYMTSFQSRLGVDPWLQPYTGQTIADLPSKGIKHLAVVMPAFVSDCLETIEEIGMEAKASFLSNGGESFKVIPCLNDREDWAELIASWTKNESSFKELV